MVSRIPTKQLVKMLQLNESKDFNRISGLPILGVVLVLLKYFDKITLDWFWVLLPFLIFFFVILTVLFIVCITKKED